MPARNEHLASEPLDKFHEIELQKLFDAIVTLHAHRVQAFTFVASIDLGALSVALSTQRAGVVIFAGIFVCLSIAFDLVQQGVIARFIYRGMILEERFCPNDCDTYLSLLELDELGKKLREIVKLTDRNERISKLDVVSRQTFAIVTFWIPALIAVVQIITGIVLWLDYHWMLF